MQDGDLHDVHDDGHDVHEETTAVRPSLAAGAANDVAPGALIGDNLRLVRMIAAGASSEVYQAENLIARKPCAVKILHRELGAGPVARGRFSHEASRVGALNVPAVAASFGFGYTASGRLYGAAEWVQAHSLRELVRRHAPLSRRSLLPLLRELCRALGPVHAAGFAHRRLHGGNVLVHWAQDAPPQIKLLDFGVWHVHPKLDDQPEVPRPPEQAAFLAPEQAGGEPGDSRSDVYAVGVLLYELLTGRVPLLAGTFEATLELHRNQPPQPPGSIASVPPGFDEAVMRALEKDPKRRTPSVEALLSGFDPLGVTGQHQLPSTRGKVRALTTGELRQEEIDRAAGGATDVTTSVVDDGPGEWRAPRPSRPSTFEEPLALPKRRVGRRWLLVALGVTALVFAAAVVYVLVDSGEPVDDSARGARPPRAQRSPPPRSSQSPAVARTVVPGEPAVVRPARARPVPDQKASPPLARPATGRPGPGDGQPSNPSLKVGRPAVGSRVTLPMDQLRRLGQRAGFGTISITSASPRAQFFLDGRLVGQGQSQVLRRIPTGKHKLHVVVDGRKSPVREVNVEADQQLTIAF